MMELMINEKFRKAAPPLADHEVVLLKEDILAHGCRDPLVVWRGVIVDGHNRYAICKENGIPFQVMEMAFADEHEAMMWIVKNQLGRRNLNAFQRCELVLPLEAEMMKEAEKRRRENIGKYRSTGQSQMETKRTQDTLAEMAGVSHGTLYQVKTIVGSDNEEIKGRVRRGEMKIYNAYRILKNSKDNGETWMASGTEGKMPNVEMCTDRDSAIVILRELLHKVTFGLADPEMVIKDLTKVLDMMEGTNGKESV